MTGKTGFSRWNTALPDEPFYLLKIEPGKHTSFTREGWCMKYIPRYMSEVRTITTTCGDTGKVSMWGLLL